MRLSRPTARLLTAIACLWLALAPTARAEITVQVEGVDGAVRDNVLAYLSLQRFSRVKDLSETTAYRLKQRADREARAALKPFGYYRPTIESTLSQEGGKWLATVRIDPGPVVMVESVSVKVTGPGKDEAFFGEALKSLPIKAGTPLRHADYDKVKGDLQRAATSHGFLDARFTTHDLEVAPERLSARAVLVMDTGPRYRFGTVTIDQPVIESDRVRRYLRFREGDWYDTKAMLRTQFALDDTEYFSAVEVLPGERDRESLTVPVHVKADANERNRYTVAVGYATDTGARGTLGWDRRWLNRRGHRARLEFVGSRLEQTTTLNYVIPWSDPALEKLGIEVKTGFVKKADVTEDGISTRLGLTQVQGSWQRETFIEASNTTTRTDTTSTSDTLFVPGFSYAATPKGFLGEQQASYGFFAQLIGSHPSLGSNASFVQLDVRDDRRFDLSPGWHLLVRGELGVSAVADFSELPAKSRFFAGGDRSVRGYAIDELSPVDANGEKTGGRYLLVGSVEIEKDLPRNFAVAAFFDAGNAMDNLKDPLEYSVGLGVRFKLPFLSLGVDVAQSLSDTSRSPRLHLNITPIFE
jgi:translocation and assembly module TamA